MRYHNASLNDVYPEIKVSPDNPRALRHTELTDRLRALQAKYPGLLQVETVGESVEGRDIYLVSLGEGPRSLLMWSQMHGNEPTATNALLDVFAYLLRYRNDAFAKKIISGLRIYAIPMLNPDGTEYAQRRNAQGIDINRDARDLATPEARLLKKMRDTLQPDFGFNLHDQNGRRTVGRTNKIVAIALLVPPVDEGEPETPGVADAKRVASVMRQALQPYIAGHIARYDANFMTRAFGENIQMSGTRTVLLETGGWYDENPCFLVKMNFIALLEACHAIASGSYKKADPAHYEELPQNDKELFDLLIKNALIYDGVQTVPFRSDVGINYTETPFGENLVLRGRITDIGDMGVFTAKNTIDADGLVAVPGLIGLVDHGDFRQLLQTEAALPYLEQGYTTLLLKYKSAGSETLATLTAALRQQELLVNLGFLVSLQDVQRMPRNQQADFLGETLSDGALAVLDGQVDKKSLHPLTSRLIAWLNRNRIAADELAAAKSWPDYFRAQELQISQRRAGMLRLHERGRIRIGDFADLVLYRARRGNPVQLPRRKPQFVLVNGRISYAAAAGHPIQKNCGNLLLR